MTTVLGILIFAGFIFWFERSLSPFSVFAPRGNRQRTANTRAPVNWRRRAWYFLIVVCVLGIVLALCKQAGAQEIPSPFTGCLVFDQNGRSLSPREMTDKQLMQAVGCQKMAESRALQDAQMDADMTELRASARQASAAADALANAAPSAGYAGFIPTPLPGNTPVIILQTQ